MTPTKRSAPRYIFSGHALGAGAHFRQLDGTTGLNHLVPTQASSVLAPTGGMTQSASPGYTLQVDEPRPRILFSVGPSTSTAAGRCLDGDKYETEVQVDVEAVEAVEKVRIGLVRLHMLSTSTIGPEEPVVTTNGSRIEGVWLGTVEARIELDDEPLKASGTQEQLAAWYRSKDADYRQKYAWRFATPAGAAEIAPDGAQYAPRGEHYKTSVVRNIELIGPEDQKQAMSVDGYTIYWKGFGRIILGEIHVKGNDRRLTMVRLAMGSDAGGSGSVGSGQSNGHTTSS